MKSKEKDVKLIFNKENIIDIEISQQTNNNFINDILFEYESTNYCSLSLLILELYLNWDTIQFSKLLKWIFNPDLMKTNI